MVLSSGKMLLGTLIPERLRHYYGYKIAEQRFYRYLTDTLYLSVMPVELGPPMSERVAMLTCGFTEADSRRHAEHYPYFRLAFDLMLRFLRSLEHVSFNFRTVGSVLDFGCGSARFLRLLRCIDGMRLVGTDVNLECLEWCRNNVPGPEFHQNGLSPPLAFASDASFDLIFAASVFTHIPVDLQAVWLCEMHRILRPGGVFLCTVLGSDTAKKMLGSEDLESLRREGHLTLDARNPAVSHATEAAGSWDVFQTRSHVVELFGSLFCMLDYQELGEQDLLVLQKPKKLILDPGRGGSNEARNEDVQG